MKIWYDKNKINLNDFISEKFLFLPLYDHKVIQSNKDFKDNNWSLKIKSLIRYTNPEEADYIIYHDKFDSNIQQFINDTKHYNKPIIAFYNDDNNKSIHDEILKNVIVFRTSYEKSKEKKNEFALPAWSSDFGQGVIRPKNKNKIYDRNLDIKDITVSFCGALTHPSRKVCIDKLVAAENIRSNFIIRTSFWGGSPHNRDIREEYINNLKSCDLVLCCRGAGNFSFRLYETLSVGRIPIIVDTDTPLPCANVVDWNKFIITKPETIVEDIEKWWNNISETDYKEVQQYSRDIYEKFLNPVGFTNYISKGKFKND